MTATTDVAPQQAAGAVAPNGLVQPPFGLGGYQITDFRLPNMGIANQTEQQVEYDCKPGEFFIDVTRDTMREFEAIVLHIQLGMWFGEDYNTLKERKARGEEVKAWCKSSDGNRPDADVENPQAQFCRLCPRSKPQKNAKGGWDAPQCANSRQLLLRMRDGMLIRFIARKTGCKNIDTFAQPLFMRGKEPMSVWTRFTTQAMKNDVNTWFIPVLKETAEKVTPEEQAELKETVLAYLPLLQRVDEDVAHGSDADQGAAPPAGYAANATIDVEASPTAPDPQAQGPAGPPPVAQPAPAPAARQQPPQQQMAPPPRVEVDLDDPDLDI